MFEACEGFSGFSIGDVSEWQEVQQTQRVIFDTEHGHPLANGFMQKKLAWSNYFAVELESLVYFEDPNETLPSTRHS